MARSRYAWVVLAVAFTAILATHGTRAAFGAFVRPWEAAFSASRGAIAGIGLVFFVVYGVTQPLVGRLLDRWDPRWVMAGGILLSGLAYLGANLATQVWHLNLLLGVVLGLGVAAGSGVTGTVLVVRWFQQGRGPALGILATGFSAGQAVLVPLAIVGIARYGWRPTATLMGAVLALVLAPLAVLLLRSQPAGVSARADATSWSDVGAALGTRQFWCLAVPYFICGLTTTGLIDTHLIPYTEDHHLSEAATASAVSLLAILNTVGTIASGWLSDQVSKKNLLAFIYALRGMTLLFLTTVRDPVSLFIFGAFFGLADFSTIAPTTSLTADYFSARSLGFFFGLVSLSHQLGSALGAYLPGLVHDLTGTYGPSFLGAAVALGVASLMSYLLPETAHRPQAQQQGTAD